DGGHGQLQSPELLLQLLPLLCQTGNLRSFLPELGDQPHLDFMLFPVVQEGVLNFGHLHPQLLILRLQLLQLGNWARLLAV
ncbi:hypothetical protein A2U01_0089578, partial [Trifolium medium]|nr:hypothetical protein [Trifolium medium]